MVVDPFERDLRASIRLNLLECVFWSSHSVADREVVEQRVVCVDLDDLFWTGIVSQER